MSKAYDLASGRVPIDKPIDAEKIESEGILIQQRALWLLHPNTKALIKYLTDLELQLAFNARDIEEPNKVSKQLIKSKMCKEVLDYVTGN